MMKRVLGSKAKNRELGGHTLGVQVGARAYDHLSSAGEADMVLCINSVLGDVELNCPGSSLVLPLLAL